MSSSGIMRIISGASHGYRLSLDGSAVVPLLYAPLYSLFQPPLHVSKSGFKIIYKHKCGDITSI